MNLTEEESSFADISIPLTLSSVPQNILSGDSLPFPSSFNVESQSGDECNHGIWEMLHFPGKSCNENELVLDSMRNEVCDTLIAQTNERELRDWEMITTQEDHDSEFEEVSEEIMIMQTDDLLLGLGLDSDDQVQCESSGETNAAKTSNKNQVIYPRARVTLGAVVGLLTLYAIKHDLTGQAITNLLQLFTLILPSGNILPDSLQNFKAYFRKLENPFILHHYCAFCLSYVDKQATVCPDCLYEGTLVSTYQSLLY